MPSNSRHRLFMAAGALVWLSLACCLGGRGAPPPRGEGDKPAKGAPAGKFYYGATENTCGRSGCHSSPPTKNEMYVCLCTEFTTWQQKDKHSRAFEVLTSPRSKRMGELLWDDPDVTKRDECLSCHAVVRTKADDVDKKTFRLEQGVTCVVCHGAVKKWVDFHQSFDGQRQLRELTPQAKEKEYGLADLWTPHKRAELCASCHIGSLKPGEPPRFVTHDMYAAGHPPLPSFEAATFSEQMPRHWRYRPEKRDYLLKESHAKREDIDELLHHYGEGEERTRLALVSAAVSLRESMQLLVRQAERCQDKSAGQQAIDMATFDCYACHHDLKSPSWRQKRGYAGKPGRPPLRPWPTALMKLAIRQAAANDAEAKALALQYEQKLRRVEAAIEERPYGNPEKVVPAAGALAEWANDLALRLEKTKCDAAVARSIRHDIPSLFRNDILDYDSARQVAWTFRIIDEELGHRDPRIEAIVARQDEMLKLHLPSGKDRDIVGELESGLKILNSYEPGQFQKTLHELARCLDGKSQSSSKE